MNSYNDYWEGSEYSKNSNIQLELSQEIFKRCPFKETDNVLDVGCGDGKITFKIAQICKQGKVFGVDPSEKMLKHARSVHSAPNLQFVKGFAEKFNIPDVKFDYIVSCCALHWTKDFHGCLLNFQQHLKPGGKICTIIAAVPPQAPALGPFFQSIEAASKLEPYNKYLGDFLFSDYYYPHSYETYFSSARYSQASSSSPAASSRSFKSAPLNDFFLLVDEVSVQKYEHQWDSIEGFISWTKQWRPDVSKVPTELQDKYVHDHAKMWQDMNIEYNKMLGLPEDTVKFFGYLTVALYSNQVAAAKSNLPPSAT